MKDLFNINDIFKEKLLELLGAISFEKYGNIGSPFSKQFGDNVFPPIVIITPYPVFIRFYANFEANLSYYLKIEGLSI